MPTQMPSRGVPARTASEERLQEPARAQLVHGRAEGAVAGQDDGGGAAQRARIAGQLGLGAQVAEAPSATLPRLPMP